MGHLCSYDVFHIACGWMILILQKQRQYPTEKDIQIDASSERREPHPIQSTHVEQATDQRRGYHCSSGKKCPQLPFTGAFSDEMGEILLFLARQFGNLVHPIIDHFFLGVFDHSVRERVHGPSKVFQRGYHDPVELIGYRTSSCRSQQCISFR